MILSYGRRYVFVHIPKTGGTALALALEGRVMKDDIVIGDTPKALARRGRVKRLSAKGELWKHSNLTDIDGLVSPQDLADFFTLTLVRNPWDRAISYYTWLRGQRFEHTAVHLAKTLDFSAFLHHPIIQKGFRNWPARAYMTDARGVERCCLYLRLEHLNSDIAPFEAHLGFRLAPITPANRSDRDRDWRGYYTDADAALIADCCAEDIARFGYGFDPEPPE